MRYCTRCGDPARPQQRFCTRCGAPLGELEDPAAQPGADPERRQPSPEHPGQADGRETPLPVSRAGSTGHPRTTLAAIGLVAVLVLGGGGLAAWLVLGHASTPSSASQARGGHRSPLTSASATAAATDTATAGPATATPQAPASTGTVSAGTVGIATAASQDARAPKVAVFLQTYFRAINTRDYALYASLFRPSQVLTHAQFRAGYRSTRDFDAILTRLSGTPAGLAAAVTFTSHQAPADSATGTSCTAWNVTFYLTPSASGYLIGKPPAGYHAHFRAC